MSTLSKVNFEPVTSIMKLTRRDKPLADPTLANPLNAVALVDGEWLTINSSDQYLRATVIGTPGNEPATGTNILVPCWSERGRTDVQAIAGTRVTGIWDGEYEFDTRIFDAAVTVGTGAPITAVGQPLKVATVTFSSRNFTGLVGAVTTEANTVHFVGYVTRLPANNGGKLRFHNGWRK